MGGLFTDDNRRIINRNICRVLDCMEEDIEELGPVQAGMTNVVLSFKLNRGKYVYRHPGLGWEALVERCRETIMQKVVKDFKQGSYNAVTLMDQVWIMSKKLENFTVKYCCMTKPDPVSNRLLKQEVDTIDLLTTQKIHHNSTEV